MSPGDCCKQAIALKFRLLSIRFTSEPFVCIRKMSVMARYFDSCPYRDQSFLSFRFRHNLPVVIATLLVEKWNPLRAGDERFRKSPQRGQRTVLSTALATMPAIASTGAMLFTGHKGTSGKSALAHRTGSSTRLANTAVQRQVSGTSDRIQGAINCFL